MYIASYEHEMFLVALSQGKNWRLQVININRATVCLNEKFLVALSSAVGKIASYEH